ncbi:Site-specific recombinase XerD [Evansella caseinilytica]|uniref:Site-specific recombinase XerD n=1 Tax=Evansella caseinilytica TaxID=1503961 RepID=A0A1H3LXB9_9BACI|nr:site-specific integrase [Evansella caseinilytica]SDY68674.1 Site-specific recombinase XerD [Evansella caseinilytica]
MHFENEIQKFKLYLLLEKKQPSTIKRYTYDVQLYKDWLKNDSEATGVPHCWPYINELPSYYSYLRGSGSYSPNTIRRILSALRKWFQYIQQPDAVCILEHYLKETKVCRTLDDVYLAPNQIKQLFNSLASNRGLTEKQKKYRHLIRDRNEVIFRLILFYGVTIQELTTLHLNRIHFASKEVELTGRKGKSRILTLHANDIKKMYACYMTIPEPVRPNRYDAVPYFLAFNYQLGTYRENKGLSEVAVQKMIRHEIKRAGLPKHFTAQALRKTYILHQLTKGKKKETLRDELAFETTQPLDELEKWAKGLKSL